MFRPILRSVSAAPGLRTLPKTQQAYRFISTAPPHKKRRSWKSSIVRWGIAGGIVYWYSTAVVLAEEPAYAPYAPPETSSERDALPTLDSIAEQRRSQARAQSRDDIKLESAASVATPETTDAVPVSPEGLEEEANEQGAFNEETGEINWDCPCLGGMAHGPCGEQFRAAFSCFVFSKDEPKGIDCIEHFKTMQNCFREHPEVYGSELDEEEVDAALASQDEARQPSATEGAGEKANTGEKERALAATAQVKEDHGTQGYSESEKVVPKAWHDTTQDNPSK